MTTSHDHAEVRDALVDTILTRHRVPAAVGRALRAVRRDLDPVDAYADRA